MTLTTRLFLPGLILCLLMIPISSGFISINDQPETIKEQTLETSPTATATQAVISSATVIETVTAIPVTSTETTTQTLTATITPTSQTEQQAATNSTTPVPYDPRLVFPHVTDQIVVKFKAGSASQRTVNTNREIQESNTIDPLGVTILDVNPEELPALMAQLSSDPSVEWVEPNYQVWALETYPDDPTFPDQWWLSRIKAPAAWDYATGSSSITIAVVDSGVDYSHPELDGKIIGGWDFVNGDADASDDNGHGTSVAGIAAAETNNAIGIAGVSWGALILPVKVLDWAGLGSYEDLAAGIIYATDAGAAVINLSLGGSAPSELLKQAIDYATSAGVLVIAASGNSGTSGVLYPAKYSSVIAVSATDSGNQVASFSNYGPEVDIAAPGQDIFSTNTDQGYATRSGTSMAAPMVSGAAAILLGLPGNNAPSLVRQQLLTTALDIPPYGKDSYSGYGLLQIDKAVMLAMGLIVFTPTSIPEEPPTVTATMFYSVPPIAPTPTGLPTSLPLPTQGGTIFALDMTPTGTALPSPTSTPTVTEVLNPTITAKPGIEGENTDEQFWRILLPLTAIIIILAGIGLFLYSRHWKRNN
jgi:thermitase